MAQHLLNGFQIRAVFQQMGGKAVTKCMRGDILLNVGSCLIVLDDLPKALAGHPLTAQIDEQRLL